MTDLFIQISFHDLDQILGLVGHRFDRRPCQMATIGTSGQAKDRTLAAIIPIWSTQAGKGRDDDDTAGIGH